MTNQELADLSTRRLALATQCTAARIALDKMEEELSQLQQQSSDEMRRRVEAGESTVFAVTVTS
jgi:predicted  nucleic acid-binding Zn-ribbon protein